MTGFFEGDWAWNGSVYLRWSWVGIENIIWDVNQRLNCVIYHQHWEALGRIENGVPVTATNSEKTQ
jgi:hypothetical protein